MWPYALMGFPSGSAGKESTCNGGDMGSIPGLGRSHGEVNGIPLQYSCLKNLMDSSPWIHRVGHDCAHMCVPSSWIILKVYV